MDRNRIPLKLVKDDESERWLGRELGVTTVLSAELDFTRAGQNAKSNLLSSGLNKKMQSGKASVEMNLPALTYLPEDLLAVEPYPTLEKIQKSPQAGDTVFQ
jgi:hypothetical protein